MVPVKLTPAESVKVKSEAALPIPQVLMEQLALEQEVSVKLVPAQDVEYWQ